MTDAAASARPTPLHDEHLALGATVVPFAGWLMPLRYTSDIAEHRAVREAAGLFDLSHMGELGITGPGAGAFLDYALVGDISGLGQHRARYTMICAPDGGVIDDLIVYRLGGNEFMVVANAANYDVVLTHLQERAAGFDVVVGDDSAATALIAVQGPLALEIVNKLPQLQVTEPAAGVRYYACTTIDFADTPGLLARTGYTGEDGFEFFVPAEVAPSLWQALLAVGVPLGLVPAGLASRDSLRLEAGMPLYGHELNRTTTPFDAGLGRVVRFEKSGVATDFVGRAALQTRAAARDERTLVGLQVEGRRAAREGYRVLADTTGAAPSVGNVTSGVPSPTLGYPIAMAYVTPEVAAPGTVVAVDIRGRAESATVVSLPFYRRTR